MPLATSSNVVDGPSARSCCLTPSVSGGTSGTCPDTLRDSAGLNMCVGDLINANIDAKQTYPMTRTQ